MNKSEGSNFHFSDDVGCHQFLPVVRYAVLCNLDGKDPDGVPLISNVTKNVVDRGTFFDPPKDDNK